VIAAATRVSLYGLGRSVAAANPGYTDKQYASAIVIDALGGPGGFDPGLPDDAPLTPKFVADARASGITAVNLTVGDVGNGPDRFEKTIVQIAAAEHELTSHPDAFLKVLRPRDLALAKTTNRMGLIFGFEDSSMLDGNLKRLALFYDLGVRICQPTYNQRNLMGDGCLEPNDGGLSRLGHDFVGEMNRLHMLLDLSHGGPRTIAEAIASKTPVAISHTGCRALVDFRETPATANSRRSRTGAASRVSTLCHFLENPASHTQRISSGILSTPLMYAVKIMSALERMGISHESS
jgi:membrane dipeptidase